MKIILGTLGTIIAVVLAFVIAGLGTFFALTACDDYIWHSHDGQAGMGYALLGFWAGIISAIIVVVLAIRYFWRKYSSPLPD